MGAFEAGGLERFVAAQATTYQAALDELKVGRKRTHWMWFIFPQHRGLGRSPTAEFYGLASLEEARAYLDHPLLGPRLAFCTDTVLRHSDRTLREILGAPDDLKFVSSMSLFRIAAAADGGPYQRALDTWCGGALDPRTVELARR